MKLHIITIGKPKLAYAQTGLAEYLGRLKHFHQLKVTHLNDRLNNAEHILLAAGSAYIVSLVIEGKSFTSRQLATFLSDRALDGREICFIIGGPDGLPDEVKQKSQLQWSVSDLTLPHDLAMVVLAETLYRACAINARLPYHR